MSNTADLIKVLRERTGAGIVDCKKALDANNSDIDKSIDWLREKGITKSAKKADRIAAEGLTGFAVEGDYAAVVEINSETDFVAKNDLFVQLIKEVTAIVLKHKPATLEAALALPAATGTVNDAIIGLTARIGEKISLRRFKIVKKEKTDSFGAYSHMGGKISVVVVLKNTDRADIAKDIAMHIAASDPQYITRSEVSADWIAKETHIQTEAAKQDPAMADKPADKLPGIIQGRVNKRLQEMCLVDQPFIKNPTLTVGKFLQASGTSASSFVRYLVGEGMEKKVDNFVEDVMIQVKKANG